MRTTLLEKARAVKVYTRKRGIRDEELAVLSIAWARGEIGVVQAAKAIYGKEARGNGAGIYLRLALGLKKYIQDKKL